MIFLNYEDGLKSATAYFVGEDREYFYFISRMDNLYDFSIGGKTGEVVLLPEEELTKIAEEIKKELEKEKLKFNQLASLLLICQ